VTEKYTFLLVCVCMYVCEYKECLRRNIKRGGKKEIRKIKRNRIKCTPEIIPVFKSDKNKRRNFHQSHVKYDV